MKVSSLKIDTVKREQGEWVRDIPDMGELAIKTRGINNRDWRKLRDKLLAAVPRQRRMNGSLAPEDQDRINNTCLLETCLQDWSGIEGDDGQPIAYSKEQAREYIMNPDFEPFRDAVMWAAMRVGERNVEDVEDAAKN